MNTSTMNTPTMNIPTPKNPLLKVAVVLLLALGTTLAVTPTSVRAHAQVVRTTPANASTLTAAPSSVSVVFNEPVSTTSTKVQLLSASGSPVAASFAVSSDKSTYTLTPRKRLTPGLYVLRFAVTSADGHPVSGASSFLVGTRPTGKPVSVKLTDSTSVQSLTFSNDRSGLVSASLPANAVGLEFRHKRLGATLQATIAGSIATAVLPFTGEWSVTLVLKPSIFTESRLLGKLTIR